MDSHIICYGRIINGPAIFVGTPGRLKVVDGTLDMGGLIKDLLGPLIQTFS
jgi:hypothetical protein